MPKNIQRLALAVALVTGGLLMLSAPANAASRAPRPGGRSPRRVLARGSPSGRLVKGPLEVLKLRDLPLLEGIQGW